MAYSNQLNAYQSAQVTSASPLQLVVMLYDGAVRFIKTGKDAMASGDLYAQNHNLQKAQKIVTELISCLDMNQGGEVAQNLLALYGFVYNNLVTANLSDDPVLLDQSVKVLEDLRTSWAQLELQRRAEAAGGPEVGNIAA
jgi:flagellar protein FliS